MDSLFKAFEAIVVEFSWRRLAVVIFLFATLFAGFRAFDWYTGYFTLAKIDHAQQLIEKLARLAPVVAASGDEALKEAHRQLVGQLRSVVGPSRPVVLVASLLWKFGSGTALWFLFTLAYLPSARRDPSNWNGVLGALFFGIVWGLVGLAIPPSWASWPVLAMFAVGNFLLTVSAILVWQSLQKSKSSAT